MQLGFILVVFFIFIWLVKAIKYVNRKPGDEFDQIKNDREAIERARKSRKEGK